MKALFEERLRGESDFPLSTYYISRTRTLEGIAREHWHYDTEIILVEKGEITVTVNGTDTVAKKGEIVFINPKENHSLAPSKIPVKAVAIVFSNKLISFGDDHYFNKKYTSLIINGNLILPRKIMQSSKGYESILSNAKNLLLPLSFNKSEILLNLIGLIVNLDKFGHLNKTGNENRLKTETETAIKYLKENYGKKITLSEIAEKVHLTKNYLCNIFVRDTGLTVFELLNQIRMEEAEMLLLYSDLRISEIAEKCGFENMGYFIKKFKAVFGTTPTAYKKEHK